MPLVVPLLRFLSFCLHFFLFSGQNFANCAILIVGPMSSFCMFSLIASLVISRTGDKVLWYEAGKMKDNINSVVAIPEDDVIHAITGSEKTYSMTDLISRLAVRRYHRVFRQSEPLSG